MSEQSDADADAIMQGVQRAMRVTVAREEEKLETNLAFLCDRWFHEPLRWAFRHGLGHHEFVSKPGEHEPGDACVGSAGNFGGPGCNGDGIVCSDSGRHWLQPLFCPKAETLLGRYEAFSEELTSILYRAAHARPQTKGGASK